MKVLTVFGTAHNLGWPSTQTGQVYWLYNDWVHLCFKDCHPRSLYNLWCVGVGSSQQLLGALSSSLLRLQCCDGVAAHMPPPRLTSLSCLTASPAAMDTAYRESSWLPPLSFPWTPHASLASVLAAFPDNARRKDPLLRFRATHNDSRRRSPRRLPTWRMLRPSWAFPCLVSSGCFCVFTSHFKLEQVSPMSRFGHCCRHVPGIGCNCQWKQHQPHHRPRWGEPP